jgi:hypothetical protein
MSIQSQHEGSIEDERYAVNLPVAPTVAPRGAPKGNSRARGHGAPRGNINARKHGLNSLKKAWSQLGNRALDGRSQASVAIRKWRAELIADLGGDEAASTQQLAVIDLAGKQKLLLDSIDTWLLSQPSLINSRKRSLIPVVLQRQQLANALVDYLTKLGLERRHKVKTLHEILAQPQQPEQPDPPKENEQNQAEE